MMMSVERVPLTKRQITMLKRRFKKHLQVVQDLRSSCMIHGAETLAPLLGRYKGLKGVSALTVIPGQLATNAQPQSKRTCF